MSSGFQRAVDAGLWNRANNPVRQRESVLALPAVAAAAHDTCAQESSDQPAAEKSKSWRYPDRPKLFPDGRLLVSHLRGGIVVDCSQ